MSGPTPIGDALYQYISVRTPARFHAGLLRASEREAHPRIEADQSSRRAWWRRSLSNRGTIESDADEQIRALGEAVEALL